MYATIDQVEVGYRALTDTEKGKCEALLEEAAVMIDAIAPNARSNAKQIVSCRMVRRALVSADDTMMGATQGSVSALGYTQSWTMGNGSAGELYISRAEKAMLGAGQKIGVSNPYGGFENDKGHNCHII